ncbi:DUF6701 domain-containing protein [Shewanella sp. GXUN23E]|uniref:DUF6701 domain-containing protein n=1 Tax=Shewanella sp. GXUN23E TaxID=3422498 RepID=UPI003D7E11A5
MAVVQCSDIFTNPPTGNHGDALKPPAHVWPPQSGSYLECVDDKHLGGNVCTTDRPSASKRQWFAARFNAGDYAYEEGVFKHWVSVTTPQKTTRFYFKRLELANSTLNASHDESHLIIYVERNLTITGTPEIDGILYVRGDAEISGNVDLEGGLAAGGSLDFGEKNFDFEDEAIKDADFGGMCENGDVQPPVHVEYGRSLTQTGSGNVVFDIPFPEGIKPLVFLMPTISETEPERDLPATLKLTHIDRFGFSYEQYAAPRRHGNGTVRPMTQVDWLAVSRGEYNLPQGPQFKAGVLSAQRALGLGGDAWMPVTSSGRYNVFLTQRQDDTQNCWLTSLAQVSPTGLDVALDTSEVRDVTSSNTLVCRPGGAASLNNVPVAYMALAAGKGTLMLNGKSLRYEFGRGRTTPSNQITSLTEQCRFLNDFQQTFQSSPVVIAGKQSRHGGDGGWLRRCRLSRDSLSMVNDEDLYNDVDRQHVGEGFGYVAFEWTDAPLAPVHHFELSYSGSPLACAPLTVTVKACDNADCSSLYPAPVRVALSASSPQAKWTPANLELNGEAQVLLSHLPSTPLTIDATTATSPVLARTLCRANGGAASTSACTLSFAEAGFLIDDQSAYAGQTLTTRIQAVRRSDSALECQPTFGGQTKPLTLSREDLTPVVSRAELTAGRQIVAPAGSVHHLSFDAEGIATLDLQFADAGHLSLNASYAGTGEDEGLVMSSVNGNLKFVPYALCVSAPAEAEYRALADPAYITAGSEFPLAVSAHAWGGVNAPLCQAAVTPSFAYDGIELHSEFARAYIPESERNASWLDGVVSPGSYDHGSGSATELQISQTEVGVYHLSAGLPDGVTYLDSGLLVQAAKSLPLGRFVPAWYQVSGVELMPTCGAFSGGTAFSYMDQPMPLSMTLTAQNTAGQQTYNYQGWLARAQGMLVAENADNGVDLSARVSALPGLLWQVGKAGVSGSAVSFSRTLPPHADGPFSQLGIGLTVLDGDGGLGSIRDADMNPELAGAAGGMTAKQLNTLDLRHGRVTLHNTYGHEAATLGMPLAAEYWHNGWRVNTDDQCSRVQPGSGGQINSALALQHTDDTLGYRYQPALIPGQAISRDGRGALIRGRFELQWLALSSGSSTPYRGKVTAPVAVAPWLKWYWNWQGDAPTRLQDPRASAVFGRHRGHDKVIFHREVL